MSQQNEYNLVFKISAIKKEPMKKCIYPYLMKFPITEKFYSCRDSNLSYK